MGVERGGNNHEALRLETAKRHGRDVEDLGNLPNNGSEQVCQRYGLGDKRGDTT
jgi:hypothetical protein